MEQQLGEFLDTLQHDKGYARNTIEAYRNDLTQFLHFAQNERQTLTHWARVDKPLLLTFVLHLEERGYTPASVARKLAVLKSFFHFLVEHRLVENDPTNTLGSPKIEKRLPQILTADETARLLAAPAHNHTPKGFRDRAMLELLAASGLRVTELVSLNLDDVEPATQTVRCAGRGNQQRVIPIPVRAADALAHYLQRGRPALIANPDEHALFVNPRGTRLTRQGLWLVIKEYVQEAGIATSVTPHMLRHSFAVYLLNQGENLENVQRLMGHASLATTQVYAQIVETETPPNPPFSNRTS